MNDYTYKDSAGTEHCSTTDTNRMGVETGASLREELHDAGDFTAQLKAGPWNKKLSIGPMGSGRG